jgi:superfamily II DNA or RNA helicase
MSIDMPILNCWIKDIDSGKIGFVVKNLPGDSIQVDFGPEVGVRAVGYGQWSCGMLPGFIVQDMPLSASRRTLGVGTVVAIRELAGRELVSVQFHSDAKTRWIPFERLARIKDPRLQFIRGEEQFPDSGERTGLNLMAHALRTWNEATGALDRLDVDPLPHQITLVHRILSSGNANWLIADDVGLGKTIEVGLLISALERRQNIRRILIVVPSGLTRQWKDEMISKFDRQFRIYGRDFEVDDPEEWGLYERVVVSLDLAKPKQASDEGSDISSRFGKLLSAGKWDLVIFDEAHRLSRDEAGRTTLRFKLAKALREQCDSLVLLTGTPHQGDVGKFKSLLKLVRPSLDEAINDIDHDPKIVSEIVLRNRKIDAVDAEGNFIFFGVLVKRADIPNSPEAAELEARLLRYLSRGYRASDDVGGLSGRAIGFVMTIYRKLASSSVWALYVAMSRRRQKLLGEPTASIADFDLSGESLDELGDGEDNLAEAGGASEGEFFDDEMAYIDSVITQAAASINADRKVLELESIVANLVVSEGKRLLIFTEYRATQEYIAARVRRDLDVESVFINGGMTVDEKQESIRRFNSDVKILISTEAGGEGLNLQHNCHVMVNYDLPWNPARLQQRIGRLYRYGQKEKVIVLNLTSKDTIDNSILASVIERLEFVVKQMAPVSAEYDERHQSEVLGELLDRIDINDLLEEARTGEVLRSAERIDGAIQRARDAKIIQDDILSNISTLDGLSWQRLGGFKTRDLAIFIARAAKTIGIKVEPSEDVERFDLRLDESLKGRFKEFGGRLIVECRTAREIASRFEGRVLLDFSSEFVRYLVESVTRPEFGGGYGVVCDSDHLGLIAATLVHFQNEQGEPRGIDLVAGVRQPNGLVVVDNSVVRPLFSANLLSGLVGTGAHDERRASVDAILDRIELDVAEFGDSMRHANAIFPIGIVEVSPDVSPS